jgi:urease accessory protein
MSAAPVFDARCAAPMQRARGALLLTVKLRGAQTVLDDLRQEGCLKARLPRPELRAWTTAITLNSSGGVAQGDALATVIEAGQGARLTVAAQAAERFYRATDGGAPATVRTRIAVGAAAAVEWLPQETILFDRCAADRRLEVDLAESSWFLGVETVVFGRLLMGEHVRAASWRDLIRIRRDGRLVMHDAVRLDGDISTKLDRRAVAAGGRAVATLVHAAPDAAARLPALREALAPFAAGASASDGLLVARVTAPDGAMARHAVVAGLKTLRDSRPLPRVWSC